MQRWICLRLRPRQPAAIRRRGTRRRSCHSRRHAFAAPLDGLTAVLFVAAAGPPGAEQAVAGRVGHGLYGVRRGLGGPAAATARPLYSSQPGVAPAPVPSLRLPRLSGRFSKTI